MTPYETLLLSGYLIVGLLLALVLIRLSITKRIRIVHEDEVVMSSLFIGIAWPALALVILGFSPFIVWIFVFTKLQPFLLKRII